MEGEPLSHAFTFCYLGHNFRADGKSEDRMRKAAIRFSKMCHIWKSRELNVNLKLRLYAAAVVSVLTYACEAWPLSVKIVIVVVNKTLFPVCQFLVCCCSK